MVGPKIKMLISHARRTYDSNREAKLIIGRHGHGE